jgi:uncharacterized peroxidase-related enzyme
MAYINVPAELPGITGLFAISPETAAPMRELAEVLLRSPFSLSPAERELIAAYVSSLNQCVFCMTSHAAAAKHHFGSNDLVEAVLSNLDTAPVSDKMRALLRIAGKVQQLGLAVTEQDITAAREQGASEEEIHRTVLIAAAFCMFNRYVDGLRANTPTDPFLYDMMGKRMAEEGYSNRPVQA